MAIQDQEERRKAIAEEINKRIENGAIDPDEIYKNPDFKDWLETRKQLSQTIQHTADNHQGNHHTAEEDTNLEAALSDMFGPSS